MDSRRGGAKRFQDFMASLGKLLIIAGVFLIVLGLLFSYSHHFPFLNLGRLPGDIRIKRENFSFYFPIATCLLLSLILSFILYLFRK
jgi:hypothetical protein